MESKEAKTEKEQLLAIIEGLTGIDPTKIRESIGGGNRKARRRAAIVATIKEEDEPRKLGNSQ